MLRLKYKIKHVGILFLVIVFLSPHAIESLANQNELSTSLTINQTTEIAEEISSSFTSKNYLLEINLPYDYDAEKAGGYPVLYFPNFWYRNWGGNIVNYYWRLLINTNYTDIFMETLIPSMIMVGITITEEEFTVANFEDDMIDNTDLYHLFLREELLPHINELYNTDTSQTILMGWSEVGFFIVDTFFRYPDTPFNKFVSIDGDLQPASRLINDRPYLYVQEETLAERVGEGAEIEVDLYLGASKVDYDAYNPMREISRSIYRRGYDKMNLRTEEFEDSNEWFYGQVSVTGLYQVYNPEMEVSYRIENEDVYVNEAVQFTFTGTSGNRTQVSYLWDFGDGTNSTERSPSHVYTIDGGYKANLTVSDEYNQTSSYVYPASLQVKAGNRPIELDDITSDLQNTESYQTKEQVTNEVSFNIGWLIGIPIIMILRRKIKYD